MDTEKLVKAGIQYKLVRGCYILYGRGNLELVLKAVFKATDKGETVTTNSGRIQQILQKDGGSASNVACAVIPENHSILTQTT